MPWPPIICAFAERTGKLLESVVEVSYSMVFPLLFCRLTLQISRPKTALAQSVNQPMNSTRGFGVGCICLVRYLFALQQPEPWFQQPLELLPINA